MKSQKKIVKAYQLGCGNPMEELLLKEGAIKKLEDGSYELFSQEAVNGKGQAAKPGDYFKVDEIDGKHYPYPNEKEWFESRHKHLSGDEYEQQPEPLPIWTKGEEISEEIQFLLDTGKLELKPENPKAFFNAFLWGAPLSAADDATLILYSVEREESGAIKDVTFNFVAKDFFDENYVILEEN